MLVYYFVPFIVSNHYLLFWVSNSHNSVTVQNRTHVYMKLFDHKNLGNHLLQLCPKVVKHPVYGMLVTARPVSEEVQVAPSPSDNIRITSIQWEDDHMFISLAFLLTFPQSQNRDSSLNYAIADSLHTRPNSLQSSHTMAVKLTTNK